MSEYQTPAEQDEVVIMYHLMQQRFAYVFFIPITSGVEFDIGGITAASLFMCVFERIGLNFIFPHNKYVEYDIAKFPLEVLGIVFLV